MSSTTCHRLGISIGRQKRLVRCITQGVQQPIAPNLPAGADFHFHFISFRRASHGQHWQPTGRLYSEVNAFDVSLTRKATMDAVSAALRTRVFRAFVL